MLQAEPHEPHYEACGFPGCPYPPEFVIWEINKSDGANHTHACSDHAVPVLREFLGIGEGALVGKHEPERSN